MSISRRGLIAAGLAVAAVGTMGVVSTMNANASDTPAVVADSDTSDSSSTPAADPVAPALLPMSVNGNSRIPRPVRKGRAGASSAALAAAGASTATDVMPASSDATAFGPKGQSGLITSSETETAPPLPPLAAAQATDSTVKYLYSGAKQWADTDGAAANYTIAKPKVGKNDWHSLAELALQSGDEKQIVEVGWTVDPVVFGDNETHLFVYHWVDQTETCYNCDFVPYAPASVKPGDILAENTTKLFGIQHFGNAWWIAYDTEWIGYFPDSLWQGRFTRAGLVQAFGEVASATSTYSCSQMGNAKPVDDTTATKVSSMTFVNGPVVNMQRKVTDTQSQYDFTQTSPRTWRYGGNSAQFSGSGC